MKRPVSLFVAATLALTSALAGAQTRVVTLGTAGGPVLSLERSQPANALVVRDRVYLVDAGNGVGRQLLAAGLDLRKVEHIFITHNHDDHNADWGTVMGLAWSTGRRGDIHVWGPAGTESMLQGFLQYFAPNARIRMADAKGLRRPNDMFKAHDIVGPGLVFKDDLVTVTAVENCHFHAASAGGARSDDKSYAFRIQTPDKTIVFSGDTGQCAAMVDFARGADLLLHEVVDLPSIQRLLKQELPPQLAEGLYQHMVQEHTTAEDVGRLAQAAGVKELVLTHLIPGREEPESLFVDGVRKHYKGPVKVARDLMAF
ncbi:MBL fold metallo-hydrolase [Variovorax sp. YR216]|uniref:MBL fold metallo-hydrolase n=1 Tax=Variovorax sp. YR216 TaxID=1882828 RepID=UPI00089C1A99|nr:MBL fold metallo-hydrolase [Variovorax sp. YR216]SEB25104.1 Ribonuclease BN, tRNA processing enzyme [Variovorax sp. YR216]